MKSWVLFGSMMLSQLSWAADIPGSSDLPEVERPLGSEIVRYREGVQSAIRLPLERVERVNNRLVIDKELDIEGHVVDITYELGAREEYEPFMATLKSKMTEQGAEILFSCESRGFHVHGDHFPDRNLPINASLHSYKLAAFKSDRCLGNAWRLDQVTSCSGKSS